MTKHVRLGNRVVDVDEALATVLEEMWKRDIHTVDSCQGDPSGWVRIGFDSTTDLEHFLDAAAPPRPGMHSVHDRAETVKRRWLGDLSRRWRYEVAVFDEDTPLCPRCRAIQAHPSFHVDIVMRFPFEDLPEVLRNLEAFQPLSTTRATDGAGPFRKAVRQGGEECPRMKFAEELFEYVLRLGPSDLRVVGTRGTPHGGLVHRSSWPAGTTVLLYVPDSRVCCSLPDALEIPVDVVHLARGNSESGNWEGMLVCLDGVDADSEKFSAEVGDRAIAMLTGVRAATNHSRG